MSITYYIVITFVTFFLSLLDTSYLSFLEIGGATILLSYAVLIVLALFDKKKPTFFYATLLILFYSIFSSLPILFLIFMFFVTPFVIQYAKKRFSIENNFVIILLVFFVSNLVFEGLLILISKDFSFSALNALISFTTINTIVGIIIYFCTKVVTNYLGIKK